MKKTKLISALDTMLKHGKVPHALLLQSNNEVLLSEQAKLFARALLCMAEKENRPCGVCQSCLKSIAESHPDIMMFQGSTPKTFGIDVVREIRDKSYIAPNESSGKVFILSNIETMTVQAQNALLKILEEPPANVVFILTSSSEAVLLETILSRVVLINIAGEEEMVDEEIVQLVQQLAHAAAFENEFAFMALTSVLDKKRDIFVSCCTEFIKLFRDILLKQSGSQSQCMTSDEKLIEKIANHLTEKQCMAIITAVEDVQQALERNANQQLMITYLSSRVYEAIDK